MAETKYYQPILAAIVVPEPDDDSTVGPLTYCEILGRELAGQGRSFKARLRALDGPHPNEVLRESPWCRMPWMLKAHYKAIVGERIPWDWPEVREAAEATT